MLMRLASHNWSSTSTTTSRRSWKSRSSRLVHSGRRSTQAPPAFCTSCIGMGLIPCKVMVGAKRNVNHPTPFLVRLLACLLIFDFFADFLC